MTKKNPIDIIHYRQKGWLKVGRTRMVMFDILQGFYNLRKVIKQEVGDNASYLIFQAGIKGGFSFLGPMIRGGAIHPGPEGFDLSLSVLTDGGFGDFRIKEIDWQSGWARVICDSSFEGWLYSRKRLKSRRPWCDYTRGLILGFMRATHRYAATGLEDELDCAEISCLGAGQSQCEFIIGTHDKIRRLGYEVSMPGKSIQQQLKERMRVKTREIKEANRFNERILKNAPVGVLTLDAKGVVTSANPAMIKIVGIPRRHLVGKSLIDSEKFLSKGLKIYLERGLRGKRFDLVDYPLDRQAVGPRFVQVMGIPLKTNRYLIEGLLCIMEDTTERKRMESQMIWASKLAAVGELASGVAHEINNPLASVAGYAEEMLDIIHEKRTLSSEDLNEFEEALATIIEQTDRCKEITRNLLNFARQEKLEIISTSLNDLIEKTLYLIEPDAKLGKVEIHRNLGRNLPLVETNPSQLQQVFLNILKNALDAVEPGGMIRVVSRSENGLIRTLINDNGVGIPEVNLKQIFNPFFTTKPSGSGTGLGLSICYNILEKLGGTLEVESRVDSGTTFIVSISEKSKDIEERGGLT